MQATLSSAFGDEGGVIEASNEPVRIERTKTVGPGRNADEIRVNDVIVVREDGVCGHIQPAAGYEGDERPGRVDIRWLDGYDRLFSYGLRRMNLEGLADLGYLGLVETDVANPELVWSGVDAAAKADGQDQPVYLGGVDVAPRLRVGSMECSRVRLRSRANAVLDHPLMDHKRGSVQFWRAGFGARRPDGALAALGVLNRPSSPRLCDGVTVELSRYASHQFGESSRAHPNNTATWLLSRAFQWATLEGFEQVVTYSGVTDNDGGIYRGLNMERDGEAVVEEGDGWTNRDGRDEWVNAREEKGRWWYDCYDDTPSIVRRASGRGDTQALGTLIGDAPTDAPLSALSFVREEILETTSDAMVDRRALRFIDEFATVDVTDAFGAPDQDTVDVESVPATRGKKPAAVFGYDGGGHLMAALTVTGEPNPEMGPAVAQVRAYGARDVASPKHTAQTLLAKVRDWATLEGYDRVHVDVDALASIDDRRTSPGDVAQAVGFERCPSGFERVV